MDISYVLLWFHSNCAAQQKLASLFCDTCTCASAGLCPKQRFQQTERMHCSLTHKFVVCQKWNTGWQIRQCDQQMITGKALCGRNLSHSSHSRFIYTHTSSVSSSPLLSQNIIVLWSFCYITCSCYSWCLKSTLSAWDYMTFFQCRSLTQDLIMSNNI